MTRLIPSFLMFVCMMIFVSLYIRQRQITEDTMKLAEKSVKAYAQVASDFNFLLGEFEKCCVYSSTHSDTLWGHTFRLKDINNSSFGVVVKPGDSLIIEPIIREILMSYPKRID